jgi:hypothetical protein
MPMFIGDGNFFLLMLERSNVKLYECTQHSFTEINIDDLIPATKQDRVGFDYEQKTCNSEAGKLDPDRPCTTGRKQLRDKEKTKSKNI